MFIQTTFNLTGNAISSPESECGVMPCASPDGRTSGPSGPEAAPANLSARQAKERGLLTSGTFGPRGSISSASDDLTLSLGNRLKVLTAGLGSTLFALTWKVWATPQGRSICVLRGLARRTGGNVFTSWPTPRAEERGDYQRDRGQQGKERPTLTGAAKLATWPTPKALTGGPNSKREERGAGGPDLQETAKLATWATPAARDFRHANAEPYHQRGGGAKGEQLNNQVVHLLAPWRTPSQSDSDRGVHPHPDKKAGHHSLNNQANLVVWDEGRAYQLTVFGGMRNGSGAGPNGPENPGPSAQLNPAHSRWLMGLPKEWDDCAVTAGPSSRRRRNS